MEHVLYAEIQRCVGCHSCEVACWQEHDIGDDNWRIRIISVEPKREETLRNFYSFPITSTKCTGCQDLLNVGMEPACVSACPTKCILYSEINMLPNFIGQKKPLVILRTISDAVQADPEE